MQAPCLPGYPLGMVNRTLAWAAGLIAVLALAVGGYFFGSFSARSVAQAIAQDLAKAIHILAGDEVALQRLGATLH